MLKLNLISPVVEILCRNGTRRPESILEPERGVIAVAAVAVYDGVPAGLFNVWVYVNEGKGFWGVGQCVVRVILRHVCVS